MMTIVAFIMTVIFSARGVFEKIKPAGKLSMETIIGLVFFILVMITGITNLIVQTESQKEEKETIIKRLDNLTEKVDSVINATTHPN